MKPKSLMLFVVATGCGLVAMVGAQQWLARNQGQKIDTVKVLVARAEIEPGVRLTSEMVAFKDYPKTNVPEGAVLKEEEYAERALKTRAYRGQPIQMAQLGEKGQFGTSLQIPEGMRLAPIKVDPTMIHSGIMKPGDRVDVILTYNVERRGSKADTKTRTILEYIQVYAMGNHTLGSEASDRDTATKDVKGVSLLVTPPQAELLKYAESKGTLALSMRSVLDKVSVQSAGVDANQLEQLRTELAEEINPTPPAPPEPTPPPKQATFAEFVKNQPEEPKTETPKATWKVEVYQGDTKKTYEFEVEDACPACRKHARRHCCGRRSRNGSSGTPRRTPPRFRRKSGARWTQGRHSLGFLGAKTESQATGGTDRIRGIEFQSRCRDATRLQRTHSRRLIASLLIAGGWPPAPADAQTQPPRQNSAVTGEVIKIVAQRTELEIVDVLARAGISRRPQTDRRLRSQCSGSHAARSIACRKILRQVRVQALEQGVTTLVDHRRR